MVATAHAALVILATQPRVGYSYFDLDTSFYPVARTDGIILGGSHEEDVWSTDSDPVVIAANPDNNMSIVAGMG